MAASSDYFYEMTSKSKNDSLSEFVVIEDPYQVDMASKTVEQIISYCYSGQIELTTDTVDNILAGAKELKIESLLAPCNELLEEILNESNCLQMLQLAEEYDLIPLQEKVLVLVNEKLPMICKSFEFYQMDIDSVRRLFRKLSEYREGVFDSLLKSLDPAESEFIAWIPELFSNGHSAATVRSAVSSKRFYQFFKNIFEKFIQNIKIFTSSLPASFVEFSRMTIIGPVLEICHQMILMCLIMMEPKSKIPHRKSVE